MYPPDPLLVPRKVETQVEICDFIVSKNTQVLINVWEIGRDPRTWSKSNEFIHEMFLRSDIDVKYQDFESIQFDVKKNIS